MPLPGHRATVRAIARRVSMAPRIRAGRAPRRALCIAGGAFLLAAPLALAAQRGSAPSASPTTSVAVTLPTPGAATLTELIDGLGTSARVLVVGAHPDDEDTRLIAWLARGKHVTTAYLSLTRGDGGQNLIGNELGTALGVIRTEELLAARRIDGGHQYFTRAYDFGFSKTAEETYRHWPRDSLLRDVVTVIRAFRPQVVVSVFSGTPRDGHGQHQVAGQLARESYAVAGDSARLPRAATAGLGAWTPDKLYQAAWFARELATITFPVGEYDPLLGRSYAEIAARSRSQHRSQGFGVVGEPGPVTDYARRIDSRVNAGTDPRSERSLFDGVDTSLSRLAPLVRGAARVALDSLPAAIAAVRASYDARTPSRAVPALARVARLLDTVCAGPPACTAPDAPGDLVRSLADARRRSARALALAAALAVEPTVAVDAVPLGAAARAASDSLATPDVTLYARGGVPVAVQGGAIAGADVRAAPLRASGAAPRDGSAPFRGEGALQSRGDSAPPARGNDIVPDSGVRLAAPGALAGRSLSRPWWLERPLVGDLFGVPLDGTDEDERPAPAEAVVRVRLPAAAAATAGEGGGIPPGTGAGPAATLAVRAPIVRRTADPVLGEVDRAVAVVPAVSVLLESGVQYARANAPLDRELRVTLRGAPGRERETRVRLALPRGLTADSAARTVRLSADGAPATVIFRVRGTLPPGRDTLRAIATSEGTSYDSGYVTIAYPHIRPRNVYRAAATALQVVDVRVPAGLTVGYIAGVGDNVAPMLAQLGIPVTLLDPAELPRTDLARFGAVVVGTRAYASRPALVANNARLLDYVRRGGTLVVQYGQYEMMRPGIMPYPISLTRPAARVTVEEAPVTVLRADDPLLRWPNRIVPADFAGWVQERALYMPSSFAPAYRPVLAMNDPGEPPNRGAILVARYGRGTYVYTTLSLFRQLPAGVPGGARLFVNLLAAGAEGAR